MNFLRGRILQDDGLARATDRTAQPMPENVSEEAIDSPSKVGLGGSNTSSARIHLASVILAEKHKIVEDVYDLWREGRPGRTRRVQALRLRNPFSYRVEGDNIEALPSERLGNRLGNLYIESGLTWSLCRRYIPVL